MRRHTKHPACMIIAGCLMIALMMALAPSAQAGPFYSEGTITVAAGATSASDVVALTAAAVEIDRIVVANSGAVTGAVVFSAADLGAYTAIDTFAIGATNALSQYPPGRASLDYRQALVVTGDVVLVRQTVSTNYVPFAVRDLRIDAYKPTNAADVVFSYRIFGTAR